MLKMVRCHPNVLLLGLILILAAALRLTGITYGFPYLYHPDEPLTSQIALKMLKNGDPNPHYFNYPSLFYYIQAGGHMFYGVSADLLGKMDYPSGLPEPEMETMAVGRLPRPALFLVNRLMSTVFGLASLVVIFAIASLWSGRKAVGLLAALLLAVTPAHVSYSRLITPDIFMVFFSLLALWGAVMIYNRGSWHGYLLAGIAAGLAFSTKYNGILAITPALVAHFVRPGSRGLRDVRLYALGALAGAAFLLTTPFAILDFPQFYYDMTFESRHYATGHPGMEGDVLAWNISYLWQNQGPLPLFALGWLGWLARHDWRRALVMASFPVLYFSFINVYAVRNDRTLLPLLPILLFLAAEGLVHLWHAARPKTWARILAGLAVALAVFWPAVESVKANTALIWPDSREQARLWIEQNLPAGSRVALESYSPFVEPQRYRVSASQRMIEHDLAWYIANADYLIFSEGMFGRFTSAPDKYPQQAAQYQQLFNAFKLLQTYNAGFFEIRIYEVVP